MALVITRARQPLGISPDRLLVVEFHLWDPTHREVFEDRFRASVVDERLVPSDEGDLTRVLVQFPSIETISRLQSEADRYRTEAAERLEIPVGLRTKFFDGLHRVDTVSRADRIGNRLASEGYPDAETFAVDVDLWHPGTRDGAREVQEQLRAICREHGGAVTDQLRTESLVLARITANSELAERLLNFDIVAQVNLPPALPSTYTALFDDVPPLPAGSAPTGDEPVVGLLDSGVLAGHPLLRGWIVEEVNLTDEATVVDLQGHGTEVAGIAVYGDVARCIDTGAWDPQVMVASAKVLERHPFDARSTVFPNNRRPEALVQEAIRLLHGERGCRIFNLSLGNASDIYAAGRQFPWAEVLDQLSRELDIVIVVATGNDPDPVMPGAVHTREAFQAGVRDAILANPSARICNPATAAIAVTVGSIARSESPRTRDSFAGAPRGAPAPFSRVGPGYESKPTQRSVKPEFVAYGGNFAVSQLAGAPPRWIEHDIRLGEPTTRLNTDGGRPLKAVSGTSFAAPHVSNAAAWALEAVAATGRHPSANSVRALLGVSAETPPCGEDWLRGPDVWNELRLAGFGTVNVDRVRHSLENDVCLLASDRIEDDHVHLYEVRVPESFLAGRASRGIVVSLAYDPPVRSSRRDYLSRTMWLEVLKGLSSGEAILYRTRHNGPGTPPKAPCLQVADPRAREDDAPMVDPAGTAEVLDTRTCTSGPGRWRGSDPPPSGRESEAVPPMGETPFKRTASRFVSGKAGSTWTCTIRFAHASAYLQWWSPLQSSD